MNAWNIFLWVIVPYAALVLMIGGIIWRWKTDQFGWTSRSSEIFERTWLRISSPLFHFGILFVLAGHIMGLVIPQSFTATLGITDDMYHLVAVVFGSIAGLMTIVGLVGLLVRRFKVKSVRFATTPNDLVMYFLLSIPIILGSVATVWKQILGEPGGYNYRETISVWFRSIFIFQPQVELMVDVPWIFKLHIIAAFMLFAIWPFTRLVHALTVPVVYPARPYLVYRSRETEVGRPAHLRGWKGLPTGREDVAEKPDGTFHGTYVTPPKKK